MGRSNLMARSLLRSIAARRFCTAVAANLVREEASEGKAACTGSISCYSDQNLRSKVNWGTGWIFAAAGLMAFSTTTSVTASPYTALDEAPQTKKGTEFLDSLKKPRVIFVLGGPGSGKGTQCAKIVDNYGFVHLSAGDLLRAEIKSGSANGNMIQNMIKEGRIVPSEVTVKLLQEAIRKSENDKFLIDGFPRNLENREAFETVTGIDPEFILFFDCPEEEMQKRLLSRNQGRVDDNIETIRKRFEVFVESSLPVIKHYETRDKVRKINATKTQEEIFSTIEPLFKPFIQDDLLRATELLLRGIDTGDYAIYKQLCDPGLTAFEPEAQGHLVEGLDFHKFYFDQAAARKSDTAETTLLSTIASPKVLLLGNTIGLVTYTRLRQHGGDRVSVEAFNETRIWQRQQHSPSEWGWKNIHFHRSRAC